MPYVIRRPNQVHRVLFKEVVRERYWFFFTQEVTYWVYQLMDVVWVESVDMSEPKMIITSQKTIRSSSPPCLESMNIDDVGLYSQITYQDEGIKKEDADR